MKKILSLLTIAMLSIGSVSAQDTYTVVGSEAAIFGSAWDTTAEANDMVAGEDGLYTKTYEAVELAAGTIEYKVVKNHAWDTSWGFDSDNANYVVNVAGTYDVTFTFNPDAPLDGDHSAYQVACSITLSNAFTGEGKVFIKNVATGLWWGVANDWGTHASLIPHADYVTLHKAPEGRYQMETQVSNGGTNYYFGGEWMDGQPCELKVVKSGEAYTFQHTGGNFFGSGNETLANGTQNLNLNASGDAALWQILTEADMRATLESATSAAPQDATWLIANHTFGRNNRGQLGNMNQNEGRDGVWKISDDCTNYNLGGGNSNKHCAESYHSVFTIQQTLTGIPNGIYAFTAQGFYRQDGSDNENLAQFFIGDEVANVPFKEGSENSMGDACTSFEKGLYKIDPIYVEVTDGTITVGIKNPSNGSLWVIWDNFELTYYGTDASLDQVKNAALFAQVEELRTKAQELADEAENDAVKQALSDALGSSANVTTADEAQAAVEALTAAIDKAEAAAMAKDVLPQMKKLTESTNFYTDAAYEEYYGQWYQKYEAGTLTKAEAAALQDPFAVTGWRANNTVDDLLMSTWDVEPMNWAQYYINTWSVEGASDGTQFEVPFFEYWTGDANSLGEKTLTGKIEGLEAGTYGVSAWVRVRGKNDFTRPAYGITMQVNEGTAIDAASTTEVSGTNFYVGQLNAIGEVGVDGKLELKFNVAADNNISWLSFKNVKYNKMQTFTAKFENEDTWEKVYAYTWTGGTYDKVEQLGEWPGTEITATVDEDGIYTATIAASEAPANIIFSNGLEGDALIQTEDFSFEDGKTYKYILPATDIEISPAEGDIAAALEAAKAEVVKVGNIIINLTEGAEYTVSASLEAPAALYINGNGATIDASALEAPFITMSAIPTAELVNDYYRVEGIGINDLTLNGLKNSIFYDNNTKYCVVGFYISNCVMQLATEAVQNEALVSFQGGGAKDFNVLNSTIYGNNAVAKYFVRYNNSARLDRYGFDKNTEFQTMNYQNNTFYGLLKSDGQWGNYNGISGQVYSKFDIKNNIWYNCGKDIIRRLAGGRFNGSNPMEFVNNTYFNDGADISTSEASYDNGGAILTTDPNFKDAANGDFAVEATTEQAQNQTGDLRWGTWTAPFYTVAGTIDLTGTEEAWQIVEFNNMTLDEESGLYTWTSAGNVLVSNDSKPEFKVVVSNTDWYPEGENSNWVITPDYLGQEGYYLITITFNPETKEIGVSGVWNGPTGISTVSADTTEGAVVYDMQGRRVVKAQKGLYIVNGKKVVMK